MAQLLSGKSQTAGIKQDFCSSFWLRNGMCRMKLAQRNKWGSIKNIHIYLNFVFFGFKIAVFRFNL